MFNPSKFHLSYVTWSLWQKYTSKEKACEAVRSISLSTSLTWQLKLPENCASTCISERDKCGRIYSN